MPSDAFATFEAERPRLFGLAYRLLGSAHEAEDVVQDAFLRWNGADHVVDRPSAWLAKVVTNLALNRLTSARARRERYVGPWLPEPVLTTGDALGPVETAEQRESVSLAFLTLLERLTPAERAVFVLREAFGHPHRDIAEILELSEAHCRQLHRRARQRLRADGPRFDVDRADATRLVERFLAAARDGDVPALERMLAADATSWADGGGRVGTARRPILGRERVARYLAGAVTRFGAGIALEITEVNGCPAAVGWAGGTVVGVLVPELAEGRVAALRIVANPEKLRFLSRQLSRSAGPSGS
ncbi:RNA polymerase sigma-70 factor, ECF subfamily [Amycolatopsis arida]|uniref:RNA polymerase sigma-70 factor, ECF subfamily n=1 Tax=Amycolatopsis arida TaxID=587909 RepID=A0A1I5SY59_9PSEU|nr:RNA polymerase sigma-70 factor [Amycolatopsis arida]TDX96303.1 RNA polymerase sigma-70 factor (ECF subfamily) [Amycolatopsis arida]SFP75680.1 RNA polymerase sigma-70 factor, ECF subfamily [Amycolatopsis arida]